MAVAVVCKKYDVENQHRRSVSPNNMLECDVIHINEQCHHTPKKNLVGNRLI